MELTPVHMRPATELSSGTYAHHNIEGSQFAPVSRLLELDVYGWYCICSCVSSLSKFKSSSSSLHNWDGKVTQVGGMQDSLLMISTLFLILYSPLSIALGKSLGVTRVHRVHRLLDESRSISGFTHDPSMSEELEELNTLDYQCRGKALYLVFVDICVKLHLCLYSLRLRCAVLDVTQGWFNPALNRLNVHILLGDTVRIQSTIYYAHRSHLKSGAAHSGMSVSNDPRLVV